jgi:hypothetical protein
MRYEKKIYIKYGKTAKDLAEAEKLAEILEVWFFI